MKLTIVLSSTLLGYWEKNKIMCTKRYFCHLYKLYNSIQRSIYFYDYHGGGWGYLSTNLWYSSSLDKNLSYQQPLPSKLIIASLVSSRGKTASSNSIPKSLLLQIHFRHEPKDLEIWLFPKAPPPWSWLASCVFLWLPLNMCFLPSCEIALSQHHPMSNWPR